MDTQSLRDGRILLAEGIEGITDTYKIMRTHILQRMRANSWKTLAITSPGEGEGKTTTAINLAISLAREVNQTVLLVDLDLKRPAIGRFFTDQESLGISDYLTGETNLADILIHPGIERLVIMPGRKKITHSSEILSSPRVIQLVDELKSRYEDRIILFDMPPLFAGDDVIAFLPYVDGVMLVVEDGKISKGELAQSQDLLGDKCIGLVLNKANMAGASVGYY
ncbi:CpsD/CapB family tyrosine-protein kinase [Thiocystis violacea]|uniref:CpsD/CapB family tyrosine-protein kinase n=1 Tax=Thiocystis violacea TaxID=13725 RepID=UPI0030B8BEEF